MELDKNKKEGIITFLNACNDLIDGKFILADIKISKILKMISESADIYNLIAESLINYDFDKEFEKCIVKDDNGVEKFELPDDDEKLIPLVFCLLVEIDSKRISLNEFIKLQFPFANNQKEEYSAFAKFFIATFRDAIAQVFGIEIKEINKEEKKENLNNNVIDKKIKEKENNERLYSETDELEDNGLGTVIIKGSVTDATPLVDAIIEAKHQIREDEEAELLFDRILRLTRILDDKLVYIRNPIKKSNIELILDALFEACEVENVKIIVALVMALNSYAGNNRFMKGEIRELNTICYNFYE